MRSVRLKATKFSEFRPCCCQFGFAETGIGVGAAESVDDKQAFTGQLLGHQPFQMLPGFLRKRLVVVFTFAFIGPPDGVAGGVVAHEILIFRRTAGKNARVDGDSTQSG